MKITKMTPEVCRVSIVNSIQHLHGKLRSESKPVTFACQYGGTYLTLMNNCGFSETDAKAIEAAYKNMTVESYEWLQQKLKQAAKDGYITAAFGLRVRTPLLKQSILGNSKTPHQVSAEARTAGNALQQSWGLLNTRASIAFMNRVRNSPFKLAIKPCSHIHDAQYYMVRNDPEVLVWLNTELVRETEWNDHPDIYHPIIKLGGELSVFFPTWKDSLKVPNNVTKSELITLAQNYQQTS